MNNLVEHIGIIVALKSNRQVLNVKIHARAGAPVACFTATITKVDNSQSGKRLLILTIDE